VEAAVERILLLGATLGAEREPAIVVFGRSYGTETTIVKRGPHCVQLTNG